MRLLVRTHMPALSARIHRATTEEDHTLTIANSPHQDVPSVPGIRGGQEGEWRWPEAESRLRSAFDRDGFSGWVDAALQELEAEGQLERTKRGHA